MQAFSRSRDTFEPPFQIQSMGFDERRHSIIDSRGSLGLLSNFLSLLFFTLLLFAEVTVYLALHNGTLAMKADTGRCTLRDITSSDPNY